MIAVAHRAGAKRRKIGAGLRLAVAEREQSFAALDGRQPFVLLLLGAVLEQRLRDDGFAGGVGVRRRAGVGDLGDEGDLLGRAAALAAELLRPADADPAVAAHQLGELVVVAALVERLAQMRGLLFGRPVAWRASRGLPCGRRRRPVPCRGREGWSCRPAPAPDRRARRGRAARRRSVRDRHGRGGNAAAPHAPRRSRWRRAPDASGSRLRGAPGRRRPAPMPRRTCQSGLPLSRASAADSMREARAIQAGQAIGQLVLDSLELTDQLAELLSHLGVLDGHLEGALRGPERTAGASKPRDHRDVRQSVGRHGPMDGRRVRERELRQRPARPGRVSIASPSRARRP